jgi:hypothetical protein
MKLIGAEKQRQKQSSKGEKMKGNKKKQIEREKKK